MNKKVLSYLVLFTFFIMLGVNYLTAMGKVPDILPQKEVSGIFHTPLTPAGFTFSIWGVIYFALFFALVYLIRLSYEGKKESEVILELLPSIFGMFAFNIGWNLTFGYFLIGTSVFMILAYFICLMEISVKLLKYSRRLNPILEIAFGLHLGWIVVAAIVNIYAYLLKVGIESLTFQPEKWIVIGVFIALFLATMLKFILQNPFIPLSVAWALFGVYAKGEVFYNGNKNITILLLGGVSISVILAISTFRHFFGFRKEKTR